MTIDYIEEIKKLKKEKNAVILAHFYQEAAIQDIADYVGDSLGLSKKAAETNAEMIVFAGVHFMSETAKILNPDKKVLLPDLDAGCSLADATPVSEFKKFIEAHPGYKVITYINCSAEVKALSDIICTSSNAVKIVNSLPKEQKIIFAPDKNLGRFVMKETGRDMVLWNGACVVHEAFSMDKLITLKQKHPEAVIVAHPESEDHILKTASYIGSTTGLLNYVKNSKEKEFIVATEAGILHKMSSDNPDKVLIPAPSKEDNTCACAECHFMKMNTMEKLYRCIKNETPELKLSKELIEKAYLPIKKMLDISAA
ncbi:quinolinate synthase NadA [Abyssalbus ytuae]|uniref:Quinolinate synthase n=1 Tax=Abyssalbus ytuae TaxID=2926907 RepID=A0A9E7CTK1_9FLAO|nr:quinolinate synthase NadA [Abyssalbus ytuae]UOB16317.1 quinolinate synthase NadA [Abyssalbus ytuae]